MPPICKGAPSAARVFVQLSARPCHNSILDVLLPLQTRSFRTCAGRTPKNNIRSVHSQDKPGRSAMPRCFSTIGSLRKTQVIHNPQVDEDGNEMILEITPRAANRLSKIMEKDGNPHLALRIQVESGGCHGFQYLMSLPTLPASLSASRSTTPTSANPLSPPDTSIPQPPSTDIASEVTPSTTTTASPSEPLREDDTVFAFVKDGVAPGEDGGRSLAMGPKIVLDAPSLELLKGSKVDYTMELIGSQFKVVDNPLATSSCGCGTSFDIKI
ncbi:hypothetical protein BJ170DRAFT_595543 [Xylariales sp. AK1849]|nr:hypothetical protein BJ170DRAFT_595543 [Xylariales sp. AK1849]